MFLAVALQTAATAAFFPQTDVITYTVQRGDTLDRLSHSFLVPERRWQALLGLAGVRNPRRLPVGRRLAIPRSWLRFKVEPARLASYRGTIRLTFAGRTVTPTAGVLIGEGTDVTTAANSFVTFILADRSQVVIPSQSRVRIRELRRILLTGAIDYQIEVQAGRLETKVAPLNSNSGRYRIRTPVSMTAVRGTEFRVGYEQTRKAAATAVLAGRVAFSNSGGLNVLALDQSFGATLASGSSIPRVEQLLPAPDLQDPAMLQTKDIVDFRAQPMEHAARYRAVIATDAGFIDNIAEQFSDNGAFALSDIPNGNLFVRVSAVSASGVEGRAQSYSFRRQLASIHGVAEASQDGYRFRWSGAGSGVRRYRFQLMPGSPQQRPIVDEVALTRDELTLRELPAGVYFWRVGLLQVEDGEVAESWTDPEKLTITAHARARRH
jgi:hypothetical protein